MKLHYLVALTLVENIAQVTLRCRLYFLDKGV